MRAAPESRPPRPPPVRDGLLHAQNCRPCDQCRRQNTPTRTHHARYDPARSQGCILALKNIVTTGGALRLLNAVYDVSVLLSDVAIYRSSPTPTRFSHLLVLFYDSPMTFLTHTAVRDDDGAPLLLYY
ncbi:hypothetical protein HETIRDRAFT_454888 [Heterobasidion irregulare TC 32-1]|uniref:Uncharacterized protein n=1 Tax=Heterobasidion irregulare (strain TC 32-1) TaxID=747525 RepID=W4JW02_HETIT|nr:uncharacterized protein HETIRDRAFT_454888 [Heterobasidion irregulare TC 32-1]ETW77654.1 hypothetical protein HETIRDRAFT_454888 [Heterobasidion irregulare TC 32-1]